MGQRVVPMFLSGTRICLYLVLTRFRYLYNFNVIDYEKHFGISNVSSRISNPLYGNGSVRIRSNPGNGTYVTIEFEQMEEDIDEKNNDRR